MKILFIAPIPPPTDGQSKASKFLLDKLLLDKQNVTTVNLSKSAFKKGFSFPKRFIEILNVLYKVWINRKNNDVIYLSVAESLLGNLRDIFIYFICCKYNNRMFIHMLGGAGMHKILNTKGVLQKINIFFINRIGGIIVEGSLNYEMFSKVSNKVSISIIPNFAENYLFVDDSEINNKFQNADKIQLLYLSNLIYGKGYDELADAYIELDQATQNKVNIVFVGAFESVKTENAFFNKIKNHSGLKYIGKFIDGQQKRELFCQSQVFCLPTYYPFEGQPISILEAYATGCVVITSDHSGIPFIFKDGINGYLVEKKSVKSIRNAIQDLFININNLKNIAIYNRNEAKLKYRTDIYQTDTAKLFNKFTNDYKNING
jgi:glycosyltransferase involved in cell wall biosynthesis